MNYITHEPNVAPATRHDGWTGEAMAAFLETLADTGIVAKACDAAGKSRATAYELRRRNPLFAQGWEKALGLARERLADTLLARSLEGNVEQIVKDGEIVAEKHFIDNRLGLAVLKRLDQRADGGQPARRQSTPSRPGKEPDWELAVNALRTGEAEDIAAALAMLKGDETDETDDPWLPDGPCQLCADEAEDMGPEYSFWNINGEWRTDYPPPEGTPGFDDLNWNQRSYMRLCTDEELALLNAGQRLRNRASLAEAAASHAQWVAGMKKKLEAAGVAPLVIEGEAGLSIGA